MARRDKAPAQREAVKSPFEYTERAESLNNTSPDLSSRVARSQFQEGGNEGQYIVKALVGFAGVAGEQYAAKLDKKIQADEIVQTAKFLKGESPTEDATVAGARAHAALAIQNKVTKFQIQMGDVLKNNDVSDEDYDKMVKEGFVGMDRELLAEYPSYASDIDMQKLLPLSMREAVPRIAQQREIEKISRMEKDGIAQGTDSIILAVRQGAFSDDKMIPGAVALIEGKMAALKLAPEQQEKAWLAALSGTKDEGLLKSTRIVKAGRETTLYERVGGIQEMEKAKLAQAVQDNVMSLANEKYDLETGYLSGSLTEEETQARFQAILDKTGGKGGSPDEFISWKEKRAKIVAGETHGAAIEAMLMSDNMTNFSSFPKKDIQAGWDSLVNKGTGRIIEEAKNLPEDQQQAYITQRTTNLLKVVADKSVKSNELSESFKADLHNLATLNIETQMDEATAKGAKVNVLSAPAQRAIKLLDAMEPEAQRVYLESMDDKDAEVVERMLDNMDMGDSEPFALQQARLSSRDISKPKEKDIKKAVTAVVNSTAYFGDNIADAQQGFVEERVREYLMASPNPTGERSIAKVKNWLKTGWSDVGGGMRVQLSKSQFRNLTGLHDSDDRLAASFQAAVGFAARDQNVKNTLALYGGTPDDIFPVVNYKTATVSFSTQYGPIPGLSVNLKKMPDMAHQYKVEMEKARSERDNDETYKDVTLGGNPWIGINAAAESFTRTIGEAEGIIK